MFKINQPRVIAASLAMLAATAANAEVDVAAVEAAGVTVGVVGAAVFAVVVGIKVWKWVRGAL